MKITLEYDGIDELNDAKRAMNAGAAYGVLEDFDNYLRSRLKYEDNDEGVDKTIQDIRDKLYEILGVYNVALWEE